MEERKQLEEELQLILQWENEQKDIWFWERIGRLPFKLLDRITPQRIHTKVSQILDELGNYIQTGGRYLYQEKDILSRYSSLVGEQDITLEMVSTLPIEEMDRVCTSIIKARENFAMAQGATTGIGGILTLSLDIPLLLGTSLKTLQEVAICYGYDPNDKKERMFILKCLQFSSSDIVGKQTILEDLAFFDDSMDKNHTLSEVEGWREVMITYRDNFGWKKLFQMIPVAGIVFGSILNKSMVKDIGETGKIFYKKRRIIDRLSKFQEIERNTKEKDQMS